VIRVNGAPTAVAEGATVADILRDLDLATDLRGIAVAVDGEVVPRGEWHSARVPAEARVEIVAAVQGG
jgi:sulfur carrier protein